jgi:hypothetical protein
VHEWRMSVTCCGGLAMCAKENSRDSDLANWCSELQIIAAGRERALEDRWTVEAAFAWNACRNKGDVPAAVARLETALRELSRRDVDHWLRLELEAVRIDEFVSGRVSTQRRSQLAILGKHYGAAAIVHEAQARLSMSPTCGRAS